MNGLVFRKIDKTDKNQVFNLMDEVLENLERKEFFIPFSEEEKAIFFD